MNEPNVEDIRKYLQNKEVQERIQKRMQDARSKATVTISRAAGLFDFSESQLREWEKRGLLKTARPALSQDSKTSTGHRQYTPDELDKLALIKELLDQDFGVSDIPQNIDVIWKQILAEQQDQTLAVDRHETRHVHETKHFLIDKRVDHADQENIWRYFVSQVLRLSLLLICEDIPNTIAGLIIPLQQDVDITTVKDPKDLFKVGLSLVGWLGPNKTFYAFLDATPSFEYPSDFRIEQLPILGIDSPQYYPLIIVQRKAKPLYLSFALVETVQRLLQLVAAHIDDWQPCFDYGMRDWVYQVTDFTNRPNVSDAVLNGLMDMMVELGGKTTDGKERWRFCCILLQQEADLMLPLRQRSLVVQAQSKNAPYKVGITTLSPDKNVNSLTLRAFQSGHLVYRPEISSADATIALLELEKPMRSAIAVSIGGEKGNPIAVLYVVSDEVRAFSSADQRMLRMMGRIVEELLLTYHARQQVTENLEDLIMKPSLIDPLFGDFLSENDFRQDVEEILIDIKKRMQGKPLTKHIAQPEKDLLSENVISFIGVDIDNQNFLAIKYGDQMVRELSRAIGLRLQEVLKSLFTKHTDCKLYHINANRFYLLLKGIPLRQAREKAEVMRQAFEGQIAIERQALPSIVLSDVTVRLGVASFLHEKLEENLVSDDETVDIVAEVKSKIVRALDVALKMGMDAGGNVVIAWNYEVGGGGAFVRWSPPKNR